MYCVLLLFFVDISFSEDELYFENLEFYNKSYYDFLNNQQTLINDVFKNYDATVSPVYMRTTIIKDEYDIQHSPNIWNYTVFLYYLKLLEIDEPSQKIDVAMELIEYWHDARLTWNYTKYNQTSIYVRQEKIWSPTLYAFGVNEIEDFRDQDFRQASVHFSGQVFTYIPLRISANCALDMQLFPFDKQTCRISFSQPIYYYKEVQVFSQVYELIQKKEGLSTMGNSEWEITSLVANVRSEMFDDGFGNIQLAAFVITLKRNPMYYFYMIILPSFIINTISIIGVFLKGADRMSKARL
ncbi:unnamed protein product [Caenorhabditis angaria]|uniref:Neurotransmitter-gated ion-channel ligand-binding domain-containing protein n=1 Tax=Caenorhabditis angaria TaxID=860376 RepID=A0A9P1NB16_9PELO|nr:unnamed protein product [Caenorhabditis angaria]